jgi:hypothetical protein
VAVWTFSEATEVSTDAKLHIFSPQSCNLTIAKTSLNGDEQEGSIASSNPSCRTRSCQKSSRLFFGKKLHRSALMTFRRMASTRWHCRASASSQIATY